ncbi:MAG: sigma 54-interacting transcriptional regulator [Planctomycetaceae bacterium]|jgi:transcriptional regulator with GAF, ATPase, and Fis domain|nr:sigma 54-interacting transcriptional regulator [Planctomycetaceae bacterium]
MPESESESDQYGVILPGLSTKCSEDEETMKSAVAAYQEERDAEYRRLSYGHTLGLRRILGKDTFSWHVAYMLHVNEQIQFKIGNDESKNLGFYKQFMPSSFCELDVSAKKQVCNLLELNDLKQLTDDLWEQENGQCAKIVLDKLNEKCAKTDAYRVDFHDFFLTKEEYINAKKSIVPPGPEIQEGFDLETFHKEKLEKFKQANSVNNTLVAFLQDRTKQFRKNWAFPDGQSDSQLVQLTYHPICDENSPYFIVEYPLYHNGIFFGWLFLFLNGNIVTTDEEIKEVFSRLKFVRDELVERVYFRTTRFFTNENSDAVDRRTLWMLTRVAMTLGCPYLKYENETLSFYSSPDKEKTKNDIKIKKTLSFFRNKLDFEVTFYYPKEVDERLKKKIRPEKSGMDLINNRLDRHNQRIKHVSSFFALNNPSFSSRSAIEENVVNLVNKRQQNLVILLSGEDGVGKRTLSEKISKKLGKKYVIENCETSVTSDELNDIFANLKKENAILFLKGIEKLPLETQRTLSNILDNQKFNFILICSTNCKDLRQKVKEDKFAEGLFTHLSRFSYRLPSLQENMEELEPSIERILQEIENRRSDKIDIDYNELTYNHLIALCECRNENLPALKWTGNFNDLRKLLERTTSEANGDVITKENFTRQWDKLVGEWNPEMSAIEIGNLRKRLTGLLEESGAITEENITKSLTPLIEHRNPEIPANDVGNPPRQTQPALTQEEQKKYERWKAWLNDPAQNPTTPEEEEKWTRWKDRNIIGQSPSIWKLHDQVERCANTNTTVLLLGETGTGKELFAQAIHKSSQRRDNSFVAINCAALGENVLESELFGHIKGAFTDAASDRVGTFEYANKGTLFLDEVGDMSLSMQAKILRVLVNGEITRVGANEVIKVDVRIIAATHRNLRQMVEEEIFREDLWYRISVFPIRIPPFRERIEDIRLLAQYFLQKFGKEAYAGGFTPEALNKLEDYRELNPNEKKWPGNIRELENVIKRAIILSDGNCIQQENIDFLSENKNVNTQIATNNSETGNLHENNGQAPSPTTAREQVPLPPQPLSPEFWEERIIAAIGQGNYDILLENNPKDIKNLLAYLPIWKNAGASRASHADDAIIKSQEITKGSNGLTASTLERIHETLKKGGQFDKVFDWDFVYKNILNSPKS